MDVIGLLLSDGTFRSDVLCVLVACTEVLRPLMHYSFTLRLLGKLKACCRHKIVDHPAQSRDFQIKCFSRANHSRPDS